MRNLKKFLALVLAMMMVLGLMVTANADTGFTDDGSIDSRYREAVEVLTAIGMLEGDNGYVNPEGNIRRAEFSIMLYRMATGDVAGSKPALNAMEAYDQFSDVISGDNRNFGWAAKYVNYAADAGWFEGDSGVGGTFRPGDNVSYYEVLICMLRVLELADDIGDNWKFETATKATKLGLVEGVDSLVANNGYATRQEVAQLVLNTLLYTTEKTYNWIVYIDDGAYDEASPSTAAGNHQYDPGKDTVIYDGPDYDEAMLYAQSTGALVYRELSTAGSLADTNFNGLRKLLNYVGRDEFMRPCTVWIDNDNNPLIKFAHDPIKTYESGTFTGADAMALSATGRTIPSQGDPDTEGSGDVDVYYNGYEIADASSGAVMFAPDATMNNAVPANNNNYQYDGLWINNTTGIPGYEVEVYAHTSIGPGDNVKYDIIVREAVVLQVGSTNSDGDIDVTVYESSSQPTPGDIVTPGEITVLAADADNGIPADRIYDAVAAFDEDDYIAAYMKPGWSAAPDSTSDYILEVAPLREETVTVQRISDSKYGPLSTVYTTDSTYKVNNEAAFVNDTGDVARPKWDAARDQKRSMDVGYAVLYTLDGNILLFNQNEEDAAPTTGYAYLYDFWDKRDPGSDSSNWESEGGNTSTSNNSVWVRMLTTNNDPLEVELHNNSKFVSGDDTWDSTSGQVEGKIDKTDLGKLVWYRLESNGKYTVKVVDTTLDVGNATPAEIGTHQATTGDLLTITNSKSEGRVPEGTPGSAANVSFNSKTKFIVVTTGTYSNGQKNWKATAGVYSIYDVPSISANNGYVTVAGTLPSEGTVGSIVTPDSIKLPHAEVVLIVDAESTSTADGYYFILGTGKEKEIRVLDGSKYYEYIEYPAVVDGVLTTVKVMVADTRTGAPTLNTSALGAEIKFVKSPTVNADGFIIGWGKNATDGDASVVETTNGSTSLNKVENDRLRLVTSEGQDETYLVSKALTVAYAYSVTKGTLEPIALSDIKSNSNTNYAIRNTAHTVVNVLFVNVG